MGLMNPARALWAWWTQSVSWLGIDKWYARTPGKLGVLAFRSKATMAIGRVGSDRWLPEFRGCLPAWRSWG